MYYQNFILLVADTDPLPLVNGEFGEVSAPVFLDRVGCDQTEETLLQCDRSSRLGLVSGMCACDGCSEDLGVRCPGEINTVATLTKFNICLWASKCTYTCLYLNGEYYKLPYNLKRALGV